MPTNRIAPTTFPYRVKRYLSDYIKPYYYELRAAYLRHKAGARKIDLSMIEDECLDDVYHADYPDFCDAYVSSASWKDTGVELSDFELEEYNNDHGDYVHELAHESLR